MHINDIRFRDSRWNLRLGISSLDSCQKLVLENLGSSNPIWIQNFCPGSKKSFLKVLDFGSWILTMSDLKMFKSELFSDVRFSSPQKLRVRPKKTKHELQTKTLSKKFWIGLSVEVLLQCISTSFNSSSSRFSQILHSVILNLASAPSR